MSLQLEKCAPPDARSRVARKPIPEERLVARAALGRALRLARLRRGHSQGTAADLLGVSRPTLSAWERGLSEPEALDLQAMATAYGVTLDQLCGLASLPPA